MMKQLAIGLVVLVSGVLALTGSAQAQTATGVIAGVVKDNTKGATHYLETGLLATKPPVWAVNQPVLIEIGHHSFLKVA